MIVVLFRHGPAGRQDPARWPDDAARTLTPRGEERTRLAARGLAREVSQVTVVLTSPYVRCTESAAVLAAVLEPAHGVETLDALAPGGSFRPILTRLASCQANDTVVIVGHEPQLGKLAGMLLFGAPATALPLKKAGAAIVGFVGAPRAGEGRLLAFTPPRILRRISSRRSRV